MPSARPKKQKPGAAVLLERATDALHHGRLDDAAKHARSALKTTGPAGNYELPALTLLGTVLLELGDPDAARETLVRAVALDEDGTRDETGGADKFCYLAQLSEEGGHDSVRWFEKGAAALRAQIQVLLARSSSSSSGAWDDQSTLPTPTSPTTPSAAAQKLESDIADKKTKLAGVLCAVAEVYMTDLSWEPDCEARCEALITEATMLAPDSAETWQTVANVRISQAREAEARTALERSLELWRHLPPGDARVPEFAARVGLARLLLEVGMGAEAMEVLERLVDEDDESVEVWYLGGWGLFIEGERIKGEGESRQPQSQSQSQQSQSLQPQKQEQDQDHQDWRDMWISSRQWLAHCLNLYQVQDYEDERLGEHARALLEQVCVAVGVPPADGAVEEMDDDEEDDDDDDEDEGDDDGEDVDMKG